MRLLTINTTDTFNVFFSSDWHLNHQGPKDDPLWIRRGYSSPKNMTEEIIKTVNEIVKPDDYIMYGGDWCLNTSETEFEEDLAKINCRNIFMIWGNHNNPVQRIYKREVKKTVASQLSGDVKWKDPITKTNGILDSRWMGEVEVYPLRYKNIIFCGDYMEIVVNGEYICMCHYPIDVFNNIRHGAYMLCGHSHYSYEKTRENCVENRRLDLSWDGHLRPLSIQEVQTIMSKKSMVTVDHHGVIKQ